MAKKGYVVKMKNGSEVTVYSLEEVAKLGKLGATGESKNKRKDVVNSAPDSDVTAEFETRAEAISDWKKKKGISDEDAKVYGATKFAKSMARTWAFDTTKASFDTYVRRSEWNKKYESIYSSIEEFAIDLLVNGEADATNDLQKKFVADLSAKASTWKNPCTISKKSTKSKTWTVTR